MNRVLRVVLIAVIVIVVVTAAFGVYVLIRDDDNSNVTSIEDGSNSMNQEETSSSTPTTARHTPTPLPTPREIDIEVETVIDSLDHPWDLRKDSTGRIFFTQRGSGLYLLENGTRNPRDIYLPPDLYAVGEGGMMGLELSNNFETSRELYVCFNSNVNNNIQVLVSRIKLDENFELVIERDDIVTGIPSARGGRHSGCRVRFDHDGYLWIGTGDAADSNNPQNPRSLGGKILRVDREGDPVPGNLGGEFDPRIFSYGHRNIQGFTLAQDINGTDYGITSEHGPDIDDEINLIKKGNYGWDPGPGYNENVPMTDKQRYPNAINAIWSSGSRTIATSGTEYIKGEIWGEWEGDVLQAALKDRYILRMQFDSSGKLEVSEKIVTDYGRIRQVYQSKDGDIFFTTDNGNNEDIIAKLVIR